MIPRCPIRHASRTLLAVCLGTAVVWPTWSAAQQPAPGTTPPRTAPGVGVVAPAPPRPPAEFGLERTYPPEQPREGQFYPERTRSVHDPAFVTGAATTVRTSRTSGARIGLSGWTAPRVPFDFQESSGGVAFGLSVVWGVPLPPPAAPEANPTPADR
jgi:hypothetical protein